MIRAAWILAAGVILLPAAGHPAVANATRGTTVSVYGPSAALQGRGQGQASSAARGEGLQGRQDRPAQAERGQGEGRGGAAAREQQPSPGNGQGQGQGQGQADRGRPQSDRPTGTRPEQARGPAAAGSADRPASAAPPGRSGEVRRGRSWRLTPAELRERIAALPPSARAMAESRRANERMVVGALARGSARGLRNDAFQVRNENGRINVLNNRGELLLDLDEARARDLGAWDLRRLGDQQPRGNSPAFCRSGEGHPVWGRQWCLDQGFGLGGTPGMLWSRGRIEDVIYRRPSRDVVDRGGLIDVLGDIVFGRLALHALTLGIVDPLVGTFVAEPEGPRLLRVRSGDREIAEFVDLDRNDRFEVLYVVQPR